MRSELIRQIAQQGLRIFGRTDILEIAKTVGLSTNYIPRMITLMAQDGSFLLIGNGLYTLPNELLSGGPLHSFEIAQKLAKKGAISHRSAMTYHELTDQITSRVYITVPKEFGANLSNNKEYNLNGVRYNMIRVSPDNYWGIKGVFLGETRIWVTDLEKTLIDGLSNPKFCGGFREVLYAFERGITKASSSLIFEYAQKTSLAACKRLGWVLEKLGAHLDIQEYAMSIKIPYYQRLDASGERKGKLNKRWNLMENIS